MIPVPRLQHALKRKFRATWIPTVTRLGPSDYNLASRLQEFGMYGRIHQQVANLDNTFLLKKALFSLVFRIATRAFSIAFVYFV